MINVYKASDITEAQIVKGLLEASDLNAFVKGFYLQGGIGETAPADFASVLVEDEQVDKALKIIAEYENNNQPKQNTTTVTPSRFNKNYLIIPIVIIAFFIATLLSAQ